MIVHHHHMAALTVETPRQEATHRVEQAMAKAVCIAESSIRHEHAIAILCGERAYSCVHDLVIFQDDTSPRYTLLLDLD
ncbi:hypothetical protein RHE_CH01371 [Rhizobium etli CFN 42]|uniref:Uncharacterized protein n=3 Tax=Rhizobium etli TaxID=29449 RepID=Q2KAG2_RHIEC|nr:hypothetical protein RHE_CH01371 [Rhizobium etli CFN 42]ARQ09488.1 hypothetical protein NXC12_CH01420 [Rhizobium etli]